MEVKVIHGAPCSGKSTYVKNNIQKNDLVYDYDELARALTYTKEHLAERALIHQYVLDIRLAILKRLKVEKDLEKVWILSTFLTDKMKKFLEDLEPEYIEMDIGMDECLKRLKDDETRLDKEQWEEKIRDWFSKKEKEEERRLPVELGKREYRNLLQLSPVQSQEQQKRFESDYYVEGYATTFEPYLLYEYDGVKYYEKIDRNAFNEADMSDIIMQYDHEGRVFARKSNQTLLVEVDKHGLFMAADLSKSQGAKDLFNEIDSGLITKMSWAFTVAEESYNSETRTRTILKVKKVYDVSAVSIPANDGTEISARSYLDGVMEVEKREALEQERQKQIEIFKFRRERK